MGCIPIPTSVNKNYPYCLNIYETWLIFFVQTKVHISHFQDLIFDLNAVNEPASLYPDSNFAQ